MGSVTDVSHCTICSMSSDHEDMDLDLDLDLRVGDLYLDLDLKANDLDLDSDLRSEDLTTTLVAILHDHSNSRLRSRLGFWSVFTAVGSFVARSLKLHALVRSEITNASMIARSLQVVECIHRHLGPCRCVYIVHRCVLI
jgi:hypothetical protein